MKRIAIAAIAFAMLAGLLTPPVEAKGRINNRQCRQHGRIYQGVSTGSLTRHEAYRLGQQQQNLSQLERRMRASGCGLTPQERFRLEQRQDNLSHNIYNQKHDAQTR